MKKTLWVSALVWFLVLVLGIPNDIPAWFFQVQIQSLSWFWILLWLTVSCVIFFQMDKFSHSKKLLALFSLGFCSQIFFSIGGEQQLIDHCFESGHAEFVVAGSRHFSWHRIISEYDVLLQQEGLRYSMSKPPGQLLFYSFLFWFLPTETGVHPLAFVDYAHFQFSLLLVFVLPLLAASVIFPMFAIAKKHWQEKAWFPVFIFVVSPAFSLIVMHLDQALYPLVTCSILYLTLQASQRKKIYLAVLAGALYGLGCFVSFSLLPVPLLLVCVLPMNKTSIRYVFASIGGFLVWYMFLWVLTDYNPITRYENAMSFHAEWKGFPWTWRNWWIATKVNVVEFVLWMGPLLVLFVYKLRKAQVETYMFLVLIVALLLFGKAAGEVARMWLFFTPILWIHLLPKKEHLIKNSACIMLLYTITVKWLMDF